jgi:hypothetical protein
MRWRHSTNTPSIRAWSDNRTEGVTGRKRIDRSPYLRVGNRQQGIGEALRDRLSKQVRHEIDRTEDATSAGRDLHLRV